MRRISRSVLAGLLLLVTAVGGLAVPGVGAAEKQPVATGTGGAVATVELLASRPAIRILKRGGNAVDATVAAAAVLGVTEPFSAGIGGGGFMVIYNAASGKVTTIDHRERAPFAMHPESFFENGEPLPFNDARFSGLSAGVPGTVRGWAQALRRYGTRPLSKLLRPAIRRAREGFVVDQVFFDQVNGNVPYFDDISTTRSVFLDPDGTPPDVGTVFRNEDLARTYERIARRGPRVFYKGGIARAMVQAVQQPPLTPEADHTWRPGVMTLRDLEAYRSLERKPTRVNYRGVDVFGMGPPSSGGSTIGEALNILEGYDLRNLPREQVLHYMLEAARLAFADRNAYVADPAYFAVPLRGLLSEGFAAERRELITEEAATSPVAPGDPYPYNGSSSSSRGEAAVTVERSGSTTHLTVADGRGNVVSYTFTIESIGGNGIVVPGTGFLLNNELTDFDYGSTTHPNRVQGGKRPRSSMSPTIVLQNGRPLLAVGSPGGSTIITTVLQILINRLDLGMTLPEAIAEVRLSQRNTPTTLAEPAFLDSPEAEALRARGHEFTSIPEIGAATGIEYLTRRLLRAAAEPTRRGGGSALVVNPQ
ncbi:MAG: gamma-glutamyltransferase [Actinomycetota bacterium]|nr:gamma-glutamyltransferase [Actinomycetota bacterium]